MTCKFWDESIKKSGVLKKRRFILLCNSLSENEHIFFVRWDQVNKLELLSVVDRINIASTM